MVNKKIEFASRILLWFALGISIVAWIMTGLPYPTLLWGFTFIIILYVEYLNLRRAFRAVSDIAEETRTIVNGRK